MGENLPLSLKKQKSKQCFRLFSFLERLFSLAKTKSLWIQNRIISLSTSPKFILLLAALESLPSTNQLSNYASRITKTCKSFWSMPIKLKQTSGFIKNLINFKTNTIPFLKFTTHLINPKMTGKALKAESHSKWSSKLCNKAILNNGSPCAAGLKWWISLL